MTLQDAYNFFENLKIDTTIKSEIKVYERFKYKSMFKFQLILVK